MIDNAGRISKAMKIIVKHHGPAFTEALRNPLYISHVFCVIDSFLLCFLYSSMYDKLSHPDCDSRSSCKGEDLHLKEADSLP